MISFAIHATDCVASSDIRLIMALNYASRLAGQLEIELIWLLLCLELSKVPVNLKNHLTHRSKARGSSGVTGVAKSPAKMRGFPPTRRL